MSLFNKDLIGEEVKTTRKMQLGLELLKLIRTHRRDLVSTQRNRGYEGVLFLLRLYILHVKKQDAYFTLRIEGNHYVGITRDADGETHWSPDPTKNEFVSYIKGDYYINIDTDDPTNEENYGAIIIILDRFFRIKKFKVLDYKHVWSR